MPGPAAHEGGRDGCSLGGLDKKKSVFDPRALRSHWRARPGMEVTGRDSCFMKMARLLCAGRTVGRHGPKWTERVGGHRWGPQFG